MGFRFRRSLKILPGVRLNLSGSGASVSLGPRGLHYTIGSKGTRVTVGIPGTGLSWTQYSPHETSRRQTPERRSDTQTFDYYPDASDQPLSAIESGPVENINALSTSELAPLLNSADQKWRIAPLFLIASIGLFVAAFVHQNQLWLGLSALYATVFIPLSNFIDRYRKSVKVNYKPQGAASQIAAALSASFEDLRNCNSIWRVNSEGQTSDWKRNAGATTLSTRKKILLQFGKPTCIRGSLSFPALKLGTEDIYLLPDAALIVTNSGIGAINYQDFKIATSFTKFIEEDSVPSDSEVIGYTWKYVNKTGGPDRRFNFNRQLPVCIYGELSVWSAGGLNCKVQFSNASAADRLCKVIDILHSSTLELPKAISSVTRSATWPTVALIAIATILGIAQVLVFSNALAAVGSKKPIPMSSALTSDGSNAAKVAFQPHLFPVEESIRSAPAATLPSPVALPANVPLPRPRPRF